MTVRILGGALLLIAFFWGGRQVSAPLLARQRDLRSVLDALELLRADISTLIPLPEALFHASSIEGNASTFFRETAMRMDTENRLLSVIWSDALRSLPLPDAALDCLGSLGLQLGRYDLQTQLRALDRCIQDLERMEREAEEKARREARLRFRLTAAGGILLLIVLW